MTTHTSHTMDGIATILIAALPDMDCSPAIPALPAAVIPGSGGPPLFDLSNNDLYTPSDVEILDNIEEVTN